MDWQELLKSNEKEYALARPKRGMFVFNYIKDRHALKAGMKILEEGAFSAKDSIYLSKLLPDSKITVTDLEESVILRAREKGINAQLADARSLPFVSRSFDVSFHSGLIVLFEKQSAIEIVKEQVRVTSDYCFVFAHNGHSLIDRFGRVVKRILFKKEIFQYKSYKQTEMEAIAKEIGLPYELMHYDNAFENFLKRRLPMVSKVSKWSFLKNNLWLANELVLVIKC